VATRKIGAESGAQIAGIFVMLFGPDIAPRPSREVVTELPEQGESGDLLIPLNRLNHRKEGGMNAGKYDGIWLRLP
jgi:hypothetical protein